MSGPKKGGFSNPPIETGGPESPPAHQFIDPFSPIAQHEHRLPHWQQGEVYYFVTWRLADALPVGKLAQWKEQRATWLQLHPPPWTVETESEFHATFTEAIDRWLDAGAGSCVLRDPVLARVIADGLLHFDGQRYEMDSFVIMPNHVHALFRLMTPYRLESVLKGWKGFTAREINRRLGRRGALWQDDYWDRLIRNESHWAKCREYIFDNPIKAKLPSGEYLVFDRLAKERGFSNPR